MKYKPTYLHLGTKALKYLLLEQLLKAYDTVSTRFKVVLFPKGFLDETRMILFYHLAIFFQV